MIHDILGIGFGPANIALAIALEESGFPGSVLFLERRSEVLWQPDMLLPGSDIQNHPCRDLVTPRNPRSRYTFMNFLHERGMLFEHLNLGLEFPLRREYAQYVSWVASFFDRWVRYDQAAARITAIRDGGRPLFEVATADGQVHRGRSLVLAPGRTPHIPAAVAGCLGPQVFHLTEYLSRLAALERQRELRQVCVIGGSQSAIEIVLHLAHRHPRLAVSNIMRGYGYRLKDTSQFSEEVYFPAFVEYYYGCSRPAKRMLNRHLHFTNYSAADGDVISDLYVKMYEDRLAGEQHVRIHANHELETCTADGEHYNLRIRQVHSGEVTELRNLDAIVLATGFKNLGTEPHEEPYPALVAPLIDQLRLDDQGVLAIARDYRLNPNGQPGDLAPLYLNGLCESSHGYGDAGSFSLLSLRAGEICQSVTAALHADEAGRKSASLSFAD